MSNRDVFAISYSELSSTTVLAHHIDAGGAKPIKSTPYRTNPETRQKLREHIQEMLDNDIIQESSSPWKSPIVLVTKKDNSTRFCCDFQKIKYCQCKSSYPLPRIDDTLDALSNSVVFTTLDLRAGYWQIPMDKESRHLTAFTLYDGLYEFKKLPFGLCDAMITMECLFDIHG